MIPKDVPGLLVYDDAIRYKAKRVAKLSLYSPEYLSYVPNYYTGLKKMWNLNEEDKRKILKSLKVRSNFVRKGGNKWLTALNSLGVYMEDNSRLKNLPIPDYSLLPNINPYQDVHVKLEF